MATGVLAVFTAREKLITAAIRVISNEVGYEAYADSANEAEYADEQLALAARDLVHAVDGLPTERKPVGW